MHSAIQINPHVTIRMPPPSGQIVGEFRTTLIRSGATLLLSGSIAMSLDNQTLINAGTVNWTGSGVINANNDSEFRNENRLELAQDRDSGFRHFDGATSRLVNMGEIKKSGGNVAFDVRAHFENRGAVTVTRGELNLHRGGTLMSKLTAEPGAGIFASSGNFILDGELDLMNWVDIFSTDAAEAGTIEFVDTPPENIDHRSYRASTP